MQTSKLTSGESASPPRVLAALGLLRDQHERVTRARQAVIEVLDRTDEHLDPRGRAHRPQPRDGDPRHRRAAGLAGGRRPRHRGRARSLRAPNNHEPRSDAASAYSSCLSQKRERPCGKAYLFLVHRLPERTDGGIGKETKDRLAKSTSRVSSPLLG